MPNHFHSIIINTGIVRADPCVRPENTLPEIVRHENMQPEIVHPENIIPEIVCHENMQPVSWNEHGIDDPGEHGIDDPGGHGIDDPGGHVGPPLPRVIQWFKTMTTNEYIRGVKTLDWERFDGKLWQRNYYEHIIRDEKSHNTISNYIIDNPAKWMDDKFHNQ
jgi:hypothetical protein